MIATFWELHPLATGQTVIVDIVLFSYYDYDLSPGSESTFPNSFGIWGTGKSTNILWTTNNQEIKKNFPTLSLALTLKWEEITRTMSTTLTRTGEHSIPNRSKITTKTSCGRKEASSSIKSLHKLFTLRILLLHF